MRRERPLAERLGDSAARLDGLLVADGTSPSRLAEREEMRLVVASAVVRLPAREQDVILMRHFDGLTFSQIAERLGVTRKTAAGYLRRGLDTLRRELGDRMSSRASNPERL